VDILGNLRRRLRERKKSQNEKKTCGNRSFWE